eukprot:351375-Chlamydomonas_euryale.AAC.2
MRYCHTTKRARQSRYRTHVPGTLRDVVSTKDRLHHGFCSLTTTTTAICGACAFRGSGWIPTECQIGSDVTLASMRHTRSWCSRGLGTNPATTAAKDEHYKRLQACPRLRGSRLTRGAADFNFCVRTSQMRSCVPRKNTAGASQIECFNVYAELHDLSLWRHGVHGAEPGLSRIRRSPNSSQPCSFARPLRCTPDRHAR